MTTAGVRPGDDILVEPAPAGLTRSGAQRLDAIDMLRGLVIAIMVLDHARNFFRFYALRLDPTGLRPADRLPRRAGDLVAADAACAVVFGREEAAARLVVVLPLGSR